MLHRIERPFFTPIYDLLSPQFAFGRVALIGDAAVVARPHVGYGTTKAAGDALSLARAVGNGSGDLAAALTHYHSDRYDLGERCFYRGQQLGGVDIRGSTADGSGTGGVRRIAQHRWHPAPRCKRRISSDVDNVGRTAAVSRGEAESLIGLSWVFDESLSRPGVQLQPESFSDMTHPGWYQPPVPAPPGVLIAL